MSEITLSAAVRDSLLSRLAFAGQAEQGNLALFR